ncbi:MAG: hypothetical protein Q4G14_14545 [Paracoccus sp. (in: a-proteobacteria)]|uniref:hypothetical protein n=1 Tax=Paracoccus sp. TaxID=267 RepID=UPI0026DF81A6|nr:hypothetical protein [Paracoccus sp. (in: a-proteobacteria)]MDO5614447.1 hypothetical protein [Paracoccus sp. (in: a-proteobacteria)]
MKVLILRESLRASIISDVVTYLMIVLVIGTGVVLQSDAMQWLGFLMLVTAFLGRSMGNCAHCTGFDEAEFTLRRWRTEQASGQ